MDSHKIFCTFTHTDIRKRFFSVRCIAAWNALPAAAACAPNLTAFKGMLEAHARDSLFGFV